MDDNNFMILHLIIDHQVIERSLGIYEELFPNRNRVLIFSDMTSFKHLSKYADNTIVSRHNIKDVASFYDFTNVKYVIAHYLTFEMVDFVREMPKSIHFCWEIYGYDLYNQFLDKQGYKLYYTNPFKYADWHPVFRTYFRELFDILLELKGYKYKSKRSIRKCFNYITKRTNSIGVCCEGDKTVLEKFSKRNYSSFDFCNYSLKETLGNLYGHDYSNGTKVLVGNSASFSNNHMYVLKYLKKNALAHESKIMMSLSYGGTDSYKEMVMREYNKEFAGNVECLLSYMPLHEYNNIFLQLNSLVLCAWRQESIGTIFMGFYLGLRIYMSKKSPLYTSLSKLGFYVFTIESSDINDINVPLELTKREHNRNLLFNTFNEKRISQNLLNHFK